MEWNGWNGRSKEAFAFGMLVFLLFDFGLRGNGLEPG